ncbi:hypothetical protein [Kitasatospora purpeofusca]|uniref:hypothetical protein n=1 Tax=Kitasatospora purpeofusca TaxID=67352 RepID=UPI003693BDF0
MKIDLKIKDAARLRSALIKAYETELELEPADHQAITLAAQMMARAAHLDELVESEGQMVPGGNRAGMFVLHPGITEGRQLRQASGNLLAKIRGEGEGNERGHNARSAAGARWGARL